MPLSSIVVIVIRLFALNWLLTAIPLLLSAVGTPLGRGQRLSAVLMPYAVPVVLLILTVVVWVLSGAIARFVSRGVDTNVSMSGLSRADLYSFAFVFLGLFFILSSLGDVINWLHYFTTVSASTRNLYQLTRPFVTLALGVGHWLVRRVGQGSWWPMMRRAG